MSEANKPAFGGSYDQVLIDATGRNPPQKIECRRPGLTKREYYAAKAMQAFVSLDPATAKQLNDPKGRAYGEWIAQNAHDMADAMLSETERHNDMLALVEEVAKLTKDDGEKVPRLNTLMLEARRILGRDEEKS